MKLLWIYAALVFLAGCSKPELPICEKYEARALMNGNGDVFIVIDMENVKKLAQLVTGLAEGKCRLAAPVQDAKKV
jgi:uncharacterized lipoprotein YajG